MSESPRPRYQRSSGGLLAAMVVTVLAVVAFAGVRALTSDHPATPVKTVDYQPQVRAGRADKKLAVWAPTSLPQGWRATSASYASGVAPSWHLGMLTSSGKYVGVEESRESVEHLVAEHVDENAEQGPDVHVAGTTWQSWTDRTGDYGLTRARVEHGSSVDSLLVVGSAPAAQVRALAERLSDQG